MKQRRRPPSRRTRRPTSTATGAPSGAEVARLAKLARSMLPRRVVRSLGPRWQPDSDRVVVVSGSLLVGSTAGKVLGLWSEPSIRAISMILAAGGWREELRRAMGVWRSIEGLTANRKRRIKARMASESLESDAATKTPPTRTTRSRRSKAKASR